ncbi:MAG: M48 family metalloprotease [Labilithrix sp.]
MLKPLFAASIVSLGLLAACSSSDDSTPAPGGTPGGNTSDGGPSTNVDAGPTTPSQVCTTIHKSFQVKPVDWFGVFKDEAEAVATYNVVFPDRKWRAAGSDDAKKGQKATDRVFEAYKKLYPEAVEGLTQGPVVVIEEDPTPNAYAFSGQTLSKDKKPVAGYTFTFTSSYIAGATDDELAYVAAHELGHLLLRNGLKEIFDPIYWKVTTPDEIKNKIYGEYQTSDPSVETDARNIASVGDRAGQIVAPEMNGYPSTFGADSGDDRRGARYQRYLFYIHLDFGLKGAKAADCKKAEQLSGQIGALINEHLKDTDPDAIAFGSDSAKMDQLTKDYWAAEASCVSVANASYRAAVRYAKEHYEDKANYAAQIAAIGTDQAKLDAYLDMSPNEIAADAADGPTPSNIALKIQGLGVKAHGALRTLFQLPAYDSIRAFTAEDESDEAAVRIAKILGIPGEVRVNKLLSLTQSSYATACKSKLAAGVVPEYGGIVDPHHGVCWRAYRTLELEAALKTCPATWPR